MTTTNSNKSVEYQFLNGDLQLSCEPYQLQLRSAFGTSHSSTTVRTNALIRVRVRSSATEEVSVWSGYGEVGLPPKKPNCYLANYDDIAHFFQLFCENVEKELSMYESSNQVIAVDGDSTPLYDPFEVLRSSGGQSSANYFKLLSDHVSAVSSDSGSGGSASSSSSQLTLIKVLPVLLLKVLDTYEYVNDENQVLEYRLAAQCGIELAILDLWCQMAQTPLYSAIGLSRPEGKASFYTVALNDNEREYRESVQFGLKYTKHLKLKLDGNVEKSIQLCQTVHDIYASTETNNGVKLPSVCTWSVDANAAWTPELTIQFMQELEKYPDIKQFMYMIEQPFPVDFLSQISEDNSARYKWQQVKQEADRRGILIFADESVSTYKNIELIREFVHGVNFKLEKAGGVRGVLHGASVATQHNLKVWFGCMVSSRLSCTCSAHLLSLSAIGGDLDGDLLVKEESQGFDGGFEWCTDRVDDWGIVVLDSQKHGIGLTRKL